MAYYKNNIVDGEWINAPVTPPFLRTDYPPGQMIFDAPGDFTLLSRVAWFALRGYPEVPTPTKIDDLLIAAATSIGLIGVSVYGPA
jgi:hypothetical protein